ncbi:MAG: FIST N-terminal domain-containing protein [Candidatus Omnitrophota bacterium]|nr:FIST N-terminal domain-containing protein [Candidatus Omnitrophota bacterium]
MATVIGTGISTKLDSFMAGKEAALSSYYQIGRSDPSIIITFISAIFDQEAVIKGIYSVIRDTPLVGCSSAGSISIHGSHKDSVAVFIISSNSIEFSCGIGYDISKNSRLAGSKAAKQAYSHAHNIKQAYIMLSDSLAGNNTDTLRGSQEILGTRFPIIGGGAAYQYINNEIFTDSTAGVLVSGDIRLGIGKSIGWQPIGKPHKVTKAKLNIIKEIDKKIAVELYEEYFEKSFEEIKNEGIAKLGINYPIGIRLANKDRDYLTRVPLGIEENGSLILNGDIREGEDISLMIGDKDLILESARKASMEALNDIKNAKIKFALVFSDIARLLLLRKDADKEIDIVKEVIGRNIPILGCYTSGEYAPFDTAELKGQCHFNNHSISVVLFSE